MNQLENGNVAKRVLEIQGTFPDDSALQLAIDGLGQAGYVNADSKLAQDENGPKSDVDDGEPTSEDHQQVRTLAASLAGSAGAMVAGIAVLASGAAIPLVAGAALAAALGSGALVESIGHDIEQKQTDEHDRRGLAGTLVLAMRVDTPAHCAEVAKIMRASGATEVNQITSTDKALVAGINSSAWTG